MAASLTITTTDRLKEWQGGDSFSTDWATWWTNAIAAVSQVVEKRLDRFLKAEARTVYADIERHQSKVFLRGYPVSAVASVYEDASRVFGTGTLVDSSCYTFGNGNEGMLSFDYALSAGPKALKVTYTGGMAADTAALATAYPDLVEAVDQQLLYLFRNKGTLGLSSVSGGSIGGGGTKIGPTFVTWLRSFGNLLPDLVDAIQAHRSYVERW